MDNQIFNQPATDTPIVSVAATVEYAGFWRRFAAAFIDFLFLFLVGLLSFFAIKDSVTNFFFGVIVGILYNGVFDSSAMMGTPGKALMGIVIVNEEGYGRITFKLAIIRFLLKYISSLILFIGYLMQPFTKKRQTLHDMLTEVVVIKKDIGDVNYFKVYKENFKRIID